MLSMRVVFPDPRKPATTMTLLFLISVSISFSNNYYITKKFMKNFDYFKKYEEATQAAIGNNMDKLEN